MKNLRTVILAAGKGTRMKSKIPKALHEICGKPIIQYVVDVVKAVGSEKNYVVVGHQMDAVKNYLPEGYGIVEQKKQLGTADAVQCALKPLKNYRGDLLVLCGDTPLLRKEVVKALIQKHKKTQAVCTFLTAVVLDPEGYGRVMRDDKGAVVSIREEKDLEGAERAIREINSGVYCFQAPALLESLKEIEKNAKKGEFYLTDIIELFFEKKMKIETLETEDSSEGLGINTREDLATAAAILRKRILTSLMDQGVTIVDPQTTYIDEDVQIGQDTVIRPFCFIEKDVRVGQSCTIGPFTRLRSGTRIGDHVEVGNFAEVNRTKVGNRSLIKHFSYLGDTTIGAHVNIGAGTVTANFDGQKKNLTRIDDHAFIGSDSVLIAPVKIGKHGVTGAGSVLTKGKNVPDHGVAVGVPARILSTRRKSQ